MIRFHYGKDAGAVGRGSTTTRASATGERVARNISRPERIREGLHARVAKRDRAQDENHLSGRTQTNRGGATKAVGEDPSGEEVGEAGWMGAIWLKSRSSTVIDRFGSF